MPLAEVIRSSSPPPADVDRVFEAFYTTKPGGLGAWAVDLPVDYRSA
jgi:hypothetical protein